MEGYLNMTPNQWQVKKTLFFLGREGGDQALAFIDGGREAIGYVIFAKIEVPENEHDALGICRLCAADCFIHTVNNIRQRLKLWLKSNQKM